MVACSGARVAIPDMEETKPVSDFVDCSSTEVKRSSSSARHRVCKIDAAIEDQLRGRWVRDWEVAPAKC